MRIRPFFYLLLALTCVGVLVFAITLHRDVPAIMQARLNQQQLRTQKVTYINIAPH